jgi:DNA-binding CsgD family transcriptional regulator
MRTGHGATSTGTRDTVRELNELLVTYVSHSSLPMVVLDLAADSIEVASPAAAELLDDGAPLVGRSWESLTLDEPTGGLELLRAGRLSGYETRRELKGHGGAGRTLQIWVRAVEPSVPVEHALLVMSASGCSTLDALTSGLVSHNRVTVIGATDPDLVIDRISAEIEQMTGFSPNLVLRQSLLRIIIDADVGSLLVAIGQVAVSGGGVSLTVRVRTASGGWVLCECALLPLRPPPSIAFALLDPRLTSDSTATVSATDQLISLFGDAIAGAETSRAVCRTCSPAVDLHTLPSRELDIVQRLVEGDRVPKISKDLFLSQSTVRSHLSAVFRKLGVSSQQELITLLRTGSVKPST